MKRLLARLFRSLKPRITVSYSGPNPRIGRHEVIMDGQTMGFIWWSFYPVWYDDPHIGLAPSGNFDEGWSTTVDGRMWADEVDAVRYVCSLDTAKASQSHMAAII